LSLLVVSPNLHGRIPGDPVGSAYLRGLSLEAPPFGDLIQDVYPWDGVRAQRWRREAPEVDWLLVWIDLRTPGLSYQTTRFHYRKGPVSDHMQASFAQTAVDFLRDHGGDPRVDLAVNTVAYWPFPAFDGTPVYLSEPVWQEDDTTSDPEPGTRMLGLLPGEAMIGPAEEVRAARPALAFGSFYGDETPAAADAVRDGRVVASPGKVHARTGAGVSQDGRVLMLLIADGYNSGRSIGFSLRDAALVLKAAGAYQAVFLDGGGSSTLVGRGADGEPVVLNRPAGLQTTPGTLRYVANHLGFTNLKRTDDPLPGLADWQASTWRTGWVKFATWCRVYPWRAILLFGPVLAVLLAGVWRWRRARRRAQAS
jgi:hypothetical protein